MTRAPRQSAGSNGRAIFAILAGALIGAGTFTGVAGPSTLYRELCYDVQTILAGARDVQSTVAPRVAYVEQASLTEQVDSRSIETNLTATFPVDEDGYGPGYFLNGLSSVGYWYQAGLVFNWGYGQGHSVGSSFLTAVFGKDGNLQFESLEGSKVRAGDSVLLTMKINANQVTLALDDASTCTMVEATFDSHGAETFSENQSGQRLGFYNGLLTEWWHVHPYHGPTGSAVYTVPKSSNDTAKIEITEGTPSWDPNSAFSGEQTVNLLSTSPQVLNVENASIVLTSGVFSTG